MNKIVTVLIIFLIVFNNIMAEKNGKREYTAAKVNKSAPRIDGYENDEIWATVKAAGEFRQTSPEQGKLATESTYFKIAYDEKNLYVFIRAEDSEADKIKARLSRRDETRNSDKVSIIIDSYNDKRTAYEFTVNAAGVQDDGVWTNDEQFDDRPNPIWESSVSIDVKGWSAEMKIPFSQLRFGEKDEQVWGLQVVRYIDRKKENDQWQYFSPDTSGYVSNFGLLKGIYDIKPPRRVEILPYVSSKVTFDEAVAGDPYRNGHETAAAAGVDAKIGIGGNLTLDLTVNPDFGQVEADPSEVNLSAFETYFSEKRPFFIEGQNNLSFNMGLGDGEMQADNLFYSRRIGKAPYLSYLDLDDGEYAKYPNETTILSAAKLTGKFDNGISIGALSAVTAEERAEISDGDNVRTEIVEPLATYNILNVQKEYREGQTGFGGMITSVNRDIPNENFYAYNRAAYTGGIHLWHNWKDKTYFLDFKLQASRIEGEKEAMLAAQTSSARYFQRPDADHLTLDSNMTSMNGHGGSFMIGKQGNGKFRYVLASLWRSPGFEVNDLGYMRKVDQILNVGWVGYRNQEKKGIFRTRNFNVSAWQVMNFGGSYLTSGGDANVFMSFTNYWGTWFGTGRHNEEISVTALRGGPAMKLDGGWNFWFGGYSDSRKKMRFNMGNSHRYGDDGISESHNVHFGMELEINHRFNVSLSPFYSSSLDNLQYVEEVSVNDESRYIFAKINRQTLGSVLRLDVSLTPKLSIQYYGMPFLASGDYHDYKYITNPMADQTEDRYHLYTDDEISYNADDHSYEVVTTTGEEYSFYNYDFNYKDFNSNLVLRWEFRPGSTLYFVWSQNQNDYEERGRFSPWKDYKKLFAENPSATFLLKINYWFSI